MKRYKYIQSAEQVSQEDAIKDAIATLEDDFDYAISGIEKMVADGNLSDAREQVESLSAMINASVEEIAEKIAQS